MHEPFSVLEDKTVREFRYQAAKKKIHPSLLRIALVGFTICFAVVVALRTTIGFDNKTALTAIVVPTLIMMLYLWALPLRVRYESTKWTMKENRIQMNDGFYITTKRFQIWSYTVVDFYPLEGYQSIKLEAKNGQTKNIILSDSTLITKVLDYFKDNGLKQSN
ncbi:MAG: hypothetical protein AAF546_07900 [Verrucomicrobiota bacterium]